MFAVMAHSAVGQTRKYTGEPYSMHPIQVYKLLRKYTPNEENMLVAALLHDVLEDCTTDSISQHDLSNNIEYAFGWVVADMVWGLTDHFTKELWPSLNREERKRRERMRQASLPWAVQTIKYCDIMDNTSNILEHDPGFARTYVEEIHDLLEVMKDGHRQAYADAQAVVANATRVLAGLA